MGPRYCLYLTQLLGNFLGLRRCAEEAKRIGATVILGNIYPSLNAEEIVGNDPNVDIVVRGDGEQVLLEIVNHITAHTDWHATNGITYRLENKVVSNPAAIPINIYLFSVPALRPFASRYVQNSDIRFFVGNIQRLSVRLYFLHSHRRGMRHNRVKTIEQLSKECDAIAKLRIQTRACNR